MQGYRVTALRVVLEWTTTLVAAEEEAAVR
jgi:hypothetical protein